MIPFFFVVQERPEGERDGHAHEEDEKRSLEDATEGGSGGQSSDLSSQRGL